MLSGFVPKEIIDGEKNIYRLIKNNPRFIPLPEVAKFMGVGEEGLRKCIESGNCPFGIEWQKTIHGNKAYKISTYTFFRWITAGHPLLMSEEMLGLAEKEGRGSNSLKHFIGGMNNV